MVTRERRCWVEMSTRRAVAVAWASALLTAGCGHDSGQRAGAVNAESGTTSGDSDGGAGAGAAGGGGAGSCVDVSHVDDLQTDDLEVIGTGFEADDGHMIRIVATLGEPTYGLGEASIQNGAFDIFLPGVLGDYTGLAVHVDRVRNDACDPDQEFIWQMTSGPKSALGPAFSESSGHAVWKVTPDTLKVFEQVGPCSLNGIFDLTAPLPCTD